MPIKGKLKRNSSDNEKDYNSKPDSEDETEDFFHERRNKKKKICIDSGSESESGCLDQNTPQNCKKMKETSDEDNEPISNTAKRKVSKLKYKSTAMQHCSSDSSEDEPLAIKCRKFSANSNNQSVTKDNHSESEDEFVATSGKREISQIYTSAKFKAEHSSDSSSNVKMLADKDSSDESKASSILSNEIRMKEASDEDDEPFSNTAKRKVSKLKMQHCSSDSSEDEPLANKYRKFSANSNNLNDTKDLYSGSEDEPVTTSDKGEISLTSPKVKVHDTSSCNTQEPVESRNFPKNLKRKKKTEELNSKMVKTKSEVSSDEDFLTETIKSSKTNGKSKKHHSSSSSDDEPLATKIAINQKLKSQESSDLSSEDEEKHLNSSSKISKEKKVSKDKNSSNGKIEHLKKYLRIAGIHVQSYDKLFHGCKSIKSKVEKLLGLLYEKGLKGRPTIEKCKKLKKKIETKKEIAELDISNIIKSEGRPKRGSSGKIGKTQNSENSPAAKKFMRLRDIIDSEESD